MSKLQHISNTNYFSLLKARAQLRSAANRARASFSMPGSYQAIDDPSPVANVLFALHEAVKDDPLFTAQVSDLYALAQSFQRVENNL